MQRILLIEDDAAVRKALKRLFESQGYTVDLAGDGMSGLETFRKQRPSAVVLDLHLPRMSGQDVCREIARTAPEVPVIVLSGNSDVLDKVVLLEMGARDYVTKPFSPRELLARVRVALRTATSPSLSMFTADDLSVDFAKKQATCNGVAVLLTETECKTLKFLIENAERVVPRNELLESVWGYGSGVPSRTVDQHILHLRGKLEKNPSNPVHLKTVLRVGYKFVP